MAESHEGGCLCGAVRYRATGKPEPALVCHCTFCQRAGGSAFQIPLFFKAGNVEFNGGTISTYEHRCTYHGRMLRLQFCPTCATRVGLTVERAPEYQLICGGTFDDPNWFKIDAHIFTESAVNWMAFPPDVRVYEKHFITEDGGKEKPLPRQSRPWQRDDMLV